MGPFTSFSSSGSRTASGGFTYDADTGLFSNISLDISTPAEPMFLIPAASREAVFLVESGPSFARTATDTIMSFLANVRGCLDGECSDTFGSAFFNVVLTGTPAPAVVPLPAGGILLLSAFGALALRRRRAAS